MSGPFQCSDCGKTHPRGCTSHRSTDGEPCGNWPRRGATVCRYHGARAAQVAAAADRRIQVEVAAVELARLGVPIRTSDGEALAELRDRYRGTVDALWTLVGNLKLVPEADLPGAAGTDGIYGRTYHQTGKPTGEAKPHVLVQMLGDWSDRLAKIDEICVKLGMAERRVRVEEAQAVLLAGAVDVMLASVVPAELHDRARQVLGTELRRLDSAGIKEGV